MQETRIQSLSQEDLLEEEMATPIFLPGKYHGQRSRVGYRPWKESDVTEQCTSLTLQIKNWQLIHIADLSKVTQLGGCSWDLNPSVFLQEADSYPSSCIAFALLHLQPKTSAVQLLVILHTSMCLTLVCLHCIFGTHTR